MLQQNAYNVVRSFKVVYFQQLNQCVALTLQNNGDFRRIEELRNVDQSKLRNRARNENAHSSMVAQGVFLYKSDLDTQANINSAQSVLGGL